MSFDPSGSTLLVSGVPIVDGEFRFEFSQDDSIFIPSPIMNEAAAARAQMTRGELSEELRIRLAGSTLPPHGPARRALVQRTILAVLFERYELECRLDAVLGEEKSR